MEITTLLNRYFWLADLIYRKGRITREEINRQWMDSTLNTYGEDAIPERTFHRHKNAIKDIFGIDIVCDRGTDRSYYIDKKDIIDSSVTLAWMFDSFAIGNMLQQSKDLHGRIFFESVPSGRQYLPIIMDAMRHNIIVNITYRRFSTSDVFSTDIEPYCLKAFRQRWYLLGKRCNEKKERIYGLDRMVDVTLTQNHFKLPKNFDAETYFSDCFGVIAGGDEKAQYIEIEVRDGQQDYLRSLPLHHSQQETDCNEYCSTFTYYLRPTFDFVQELLKFGNGIEVVRPTWLREEMKKIAKDMYTSYSE